MVAKLQRTYEDSEFKLLPNNLVEIDAMTDYVNDLSLKVSPALPTGDTRKVFGCMADNMNLPFADESFDCYISNLSLQIVPDYKRMINEAYRVLQPGSFACFTVWGREQRTLNFSALPLAL
jgi:SAM-dependent methyltransferase